MPAPHSRLHLALKPIAGRSFTSSRRRSLAHPRHGILKEPWLPSKSPRPLPAAYFSPTRIRNQFDGLNEGPQNEYKPPDERILKLGKSKFTYPDDVSTVTNRSANYYDRYSSTNTISSPPNNTVQYPPSRDPRTKRQPPPLSLNTPAPPHRQGPHTLPRSTMDCPRRMEQCPTSRKRQAPNPK